MKQLFQFCNLRKRFLLPVMALTMSLASSAQAYFPEQVVQSREVELTTAFNEVEVIGDVTIILTNNIERKVVFQGDVKDVEQAKATVKHRKLVIQASRKKSQGKFTVYLPASTIRLLITSGKTEIFSSGTIKTRDMEIFLNGSSFVSVRYDGKLNLVPAAGYELINTRN